MPDPFIAIKAERSLCIKSRCCKIKVDQLLDIWILSFENNRFYFSATCIATF